MLNKEFQYLSVYDIQDQDFWTSDIFGPIKEIVTPVFERSWSSHIALRIHINSDVLIVIFENKRIIGYNTIKVWSMKYRRLTMDENFEGYSNSILYSSKSKLVLFQIDKVQIFTFNEEKLVGRECFNSGIILKKQSSGRGSNCRINFPYVLFWQSSSISFRETEMIVWKLENEEMSHHVYHNHFNTFARIEDFYVKDAALISSFFILLSQCMFMSRLTIIKVVNENGTILKTVSIGNYLANTSFLFNERKLFVKMMKVGKKEVLMYDLKELLSQSQYQVKSKFMQDLKLSKEVYLYDQKFFPEGGKDSGFVVTDSYISRVSVVEQADKEKKIVIKKLDFLS